MAQFDQVSNDLAKILNKYIERDQLGDVVLARLVNQRVGYNLLNRSSINNWRSGTSKRIENWKQLIAISHVLWMHPKEVEHIITLSELPSLEQLRKEAQEPFLEWVQILLWKKKRVMSTEKIKPEEIEQLISDLKVASEQQYEWHPLTERMEMYIDRQGKEQIFQDVPDFLLGECVLRTANNDKWSSAKDNDFISFMVTRDVKVYVLYTTKNTNLETTWLNQAQKWYEENFVVLANLSDDEVIRKVRSKIFRAHSKVELGGNGGTSDGTSMYNVVVVPLSGRK